MPKSSRKSGAQKAADRPKKPYPDFPLCAHPAGKWQKNIRGKIHYFGRWGRIRNGVMERIEGDGWKEALELYKAQADDLHAGRTPRVHKVGEGLTLKELCNRFLTAKQRKRDRGGIAFLTFEGHQRVTDLLIEQFGKERLVDDLASDDFESLLDTMAKRWGPVRLGNQIQAVRSIFKYAFDSGLIATPVRFGPEFVKPSAGELRRHKAKNGEKMLEAPELRRWLDALEGKEVETGCTDEKTGKPETVKLDADPVMRAMVLLGINCGFNNKDCADLPLSAIDLEGGWITFPRPKTGIERRCPLWPETVAALKAAIAVRVEPRHAAAEGLVFVTVRGRHWLTRGQANPVSVAARDAMKAVNVHRDGIGFATLRHVFRTIADGSLDQVAINRIMGHADNTMAATYRERIDDSRLQAVAAYVRKWLFG